MKSITAIYEVGENATRLIEIDVPMPTLGPRDVLVQVKAVAANPVDYKVRDGMATGDKRILGWDAAGVIHSVGDNVQSFKPGDKVWYAGNISRDGAYAAFQAVDERIISHMPSSLGYEEAAALPLSSITAWEILFDRLKVQLAPPTQQKSILIIGAGGGVGSILTQLAAKVANLKVIATASRPESAQWARSMGAHHVIDPRADWREQLNKVNVHSVDYIASLTASGEHLAKSADILTPQGAFCLIDDPEQLDIRGFKRKSISIHWELMFTRSLFETDDMNEQGRLLQRVAELIDDGVLQSTVNGPVRSLNVETLEATHKEFRAGTAVGKRVFSVSLS
ncbi:MULTISPECIES: zinc-binding alcohol dehydrogenase family protein [unclassified Methylophaga]|uniref:zinc-binding alcohol dehydrogenase family protein n=1 Tax=unclassified Methylophaga TaxID=2629249 RepID=UPI000C97B17C|nr:MULTISPECIES: zinc-binding alcohol dehydrogenase family protein [unclassified Methylophaga]MBN45180.1 NADPH:quinone reductase [Methylophaga sp.]